MSTRTPFPNNQIPLSEINPISLKLINMYPLPNVPGTGLSNNYDTSGVTTQTDNTFDTRLDYRFSEMNNFFLRYNYDMINTQLPHVFPETANGFNPLGQPVNARFGYEYGNNGYMQQRVHGLALNDTYTLSSRLVLVLRAGYSRYQNHALPQGWGTNPASQLGMQNVNVDQISSGFPNIWVSNFSGLGDGNFIPTLNTNNVYTTSGSLQWLKGSHIVKFGGEFTRRQVEDFQSQEPRVGYQFTPSFTADPNNLASTGNAMASLLLGYPGQSMRSRYLIMPGYRTLENGWYVQDDYRVNRWLTLNLGLRWDYYSPVSEAFNRISNFDFSTAAMVVAGQDGIGNTVGVQKDRKDFGPRFGFAAQVDQKTVIRGGFGINYAPTMLGTPGAFRNPPFISAFTITPNNITPINSISDVLPTLAPVAFSNFSGSVAAVAFNYKIPYVEQVNITAQRQLPLGLFLSSSYVASLGKRQSGSNANPDANGAAPGAAPLQSRRVYTLIYPNLADIDTVRNYYTSSYNALQTTLEMRLSHGMTLNANHTWAHTLDNSQYRYVAYSVPSTVKESSASDMRNRVAVTWSFDVPYKGTPSRFYSTLLRNWRINAIATAETGLPFSVTQTSTQTNSATGTNLPNLVSSFRVPHASMAEWFNPAAFVAQPNYTWGNEGFDLLNAPGFWDVDLALHRQFKVTERITMQFRFESFDFTNTENPQRTGGRAGAVRVWVNPYPYHNLDHWEPATRGGAEVAVLKLRMVSYDEG